MACRWKSITTIGKLAGKVAGKPGEVHCTTTSLGLKSSNTDQQSDRDAGRSLMPCSETIVIGGFQVPTPSVFRTCPEHKIADCFGGHGMLCNAGAPGAHPSRSDAGHEFYSGR